MKRLIIILFHILTLPLTIFSSLWMKVLRKLQTTFITLNVFDFFKIFPLKYHYYEPLISPSIKSKFNKQTRRTLRGLSMNDDVQLSFLKSFHYNDELIALSKRVKSKLNFDFDNSSFKSGDAEYLYNIIRHVKPKNIIEIGCGNSTKLIQSAISVNCNEDIYYECKHTCIEPYEQPWLEDIGVQVLRMPVEELDINIFSNLSNNDILFIDSSHMIRPKGDVLHEILHILPILNKGVLVHFHDIFTPDDYPTNWIVEKRLFWNEQYILEAFLTFNNNYEVIGAINYLSKNFTEEFNSKSPIFKVEKNRIPGSFWIRRK